MLFYLLPILNQISRHTLFLRNCLVGVLGGALLLSACSSGASRPAPAPQPTPLQTLTARVVNLERQSRLLREIQEAVRGMQTNLATLKNLQQEVQELKQLERNQNKLFLEYQEKFEERIAQIEQNLERNNLKFRRLTGEIQQPQQGGRERLVDQNPSLAKLPRESSSNDMAKTPGSSPLKPTRPPAPAGPEQLFESGLALHTAKQYLKAIRVFQQLRKDHPEHPNAVEGHYLIGDAYFSLQDYPNAAIAFYEFTDQNPQYPNTFDAKWKLAQSLEKSGEVGLALDIYQEMVAQENSPYQAQAQAKLKVYEKQSQ